MNPAPRILVTPRSLTSLGIENVPQLAPLRDAGYELVAGPAGRTPTLDELAALLDERVVGYLAGVEEIPAQTLQQASALKVISRNGVGVDGIDLVAARAAGIRVEVARAANAQGVAELTVLHMLAALRGFVPGEVSVRGGGWERSLGGELSGRTVGIVGLGAIGNRVARIASAFGARILGSDPFVDSHDIAEVVPVTELCVRADVITLHSPPREQPLVDAKLLASVKHGTVLVNTARASLVDEAAVLAALGDGRLAAYAVDAYSAEPPVLTELLLHPACHPTPHIGGYTEESVHRATTAAVDNLLRILSEGSPPPPGPHPASPAPPASPRLDRSP